MITIIDLNIGNLSSLLKALHFLNAEFLFTDQIEHIEQATKLLLPGVGAFGAGSVSLQKKGLIDPIRRSVLEQRTPILGICMGMQLFAERGFENGTHVGLGLIAAEVHGLDPDACPAIPHMGWNNLDTIEGNPLLDGLGPKPDFYFANSYHMVGLPVGAVVNTCTHGMQFVASFALGNIMGTQFHPEKSQANGLHVLKNFINYA